MEAVDSIHLVEGSLIAKAYESAEIRRRLSLPLRCESSVRTELLTQQLCAVGHDSPGDLRAVELQGHPFFVATLFQPERAALKGILPPLVRALIEACARQKS